MRQSWSDEEEDDFQKQDFVCSKIRCYRQDPVFERNSGSKKGFVKKGLCGKIIKQHF